MENELINTTCITAFLKQVKAADLHQEKEVRMSIKDAKNLAFTLGIVMTKLTGNLEEIINKNLTNKSSDEIIQITMDGGKGW